MACAFSRFFLVVSLLLAFADTNGADYVDDGTHATMHAIIRDGDIKKFRAMLNGTFLGNVNAMNSSNCTMLHVASFYGRKFIVEDLLKNGQLLLNPLNTAAETPLHLACRNGNAVIVDSLVMAAQQRGYSTFTQLVETVDAEGRTPFLIAIRASSIASADILRQHGARVVDVRDWNGYSALHLAKDVATLQYLIKSTPLASQVNLRTEPELLTPLHVAVVEEKPIDLITFLLELKDVNVSALNSHGQTVLHFAVQENCNEALDAFLAQKALPAFSVSDKAGRTPLLLAIELGRIEIAKKMIANEQHFSISRLADALPGTRNTAIHMAAKLNQPEIVDALLKRSKGLALFQNAKQEMPLHVAINYGNLAVVRTVMKNIGENEPSLLRQDFRGRTIVHAMAMQTRPVGVEMGKQLASYFLSVQNAVDAFGDTPLETGVKRNNIDVVLLFLLHGMHCTKYNRQGSTPLQVAKQLGLDNLEEAMIATGKCALEQASTNATNVSDPTSPCYWDHLPSIKNGVIELPNATQSVDGLEIKCNTGYVLRGLSVLLCEEGTWKMGSYCEKIRCSEEPHVENGNAEDLVCSNSTTQLKTFRCSNGYVLRGSSTIECDEMGKWKIKGHCESGTENVPKPNESK